MSGTANAKADAHAIPADWASRRLGDLATVGAGGTPSREVQAYWNGSIPWITTSQIDFNRIKAAEQFITEEGLRNSSAKLVPPGTLLLALYGQGKTRGKVGILDIEAATNQACASIVPHASISGEFLFHFLASRYEAIRSASNSGGQENLSSSIVKGIGVCVPGIREQQAIADVLSDVDFLLASLDDLLVKKRDLKEAAMQKLLTGRIRLPGFTGTWRQTTLGEIGDCIVGLTYGPSDVESHGLLVLRSSNIQGGRLDYEDNVYVRTGVPDHLYTRCGDILVCVRNGSRALIGKCVAIDHAAAGHTFGAFMAVFRTKHWRYIVHAFQGPEIQRQIQDNIGATINQITNKDMKAFRVNLPPDDEAAAIACVLSDIDAEVAGLESRRTKTLALKQAMMQQLLTGRIRLI